MNLQKQVIEQFKKLYPGCTLQSISNETGIQITRVFRIINGNEMKLSEYEAFQRAIAIKENSPNNDFFKLVEEGIHFLSSETIEEFKFGLMRKLSMKKLLSA